MSHPPPAVENGAPPCTDHPEVSRFTPLEVVAEQVIKTLCGGCTGYFAGRAQGLLEKVQTVAPALSVAVSPEAAAAAKANADFYRGLVERLDAFRGAQLDADGQVELVRRASEALGTWISQRDLIVASKIAADACFKSMKSVLVEPGAANSETAQ